MTALPLRLWRRVTWAWISRNPKWLFALGYFGLIFLFTGIYGYCANDFYQSTAIAEMRARKLDDEIRAVIHRSVNDVLAAAIEPDKWPKILNVSVERLSVSEQAISFSVRYYATVPRQYSRGLHEIEWILTLPPTLSPYFPDVASVKVRLREPSASIMRFTFAHGGTPIPGGDRRWGPLRGRVLHTDFDVKGDPDFVEGELTVPRTLTASLSAYHAALRGEAVGTAGRLIRFFYLSVATATTLGFGDIVPLTDRARLLVAVESILGIGLAGLFLNSALTSRSACQQHGGTELRKGDQ